jgi:hypothetical protein
MCGSGLVCGTVSPDRRDSPSRLFVWRKRPQKQRALFLSFPLKAILKERMAATMVNGSGAMLNGHSEDQRQAGPSKPHLHLQPDATGSRPGLHESVSYDTDMDAFQLSILARCAFIIGASLLTGVRASCKMVMSTLQKRAAPARCLDRQPHLSVWIPTRRA